MGVTGDQRILFVMQHPATNAPRELSAYASRRGGMVWSFVWIGSFFLSLGLIELSAQPGNPPPANGEAGHGMRRPGMDRFDLRAAEDAGRSEKLDLVQKSFERQRWDEGVLQLQSLLNDEQDSLVYGQDRVWRPVSAAAVELIRRSPKEAQRAYDARFQSLSERDFQFAQQTHDLAGLARVEALSPHHFRATRVPGSDRRGRR